MNRAIFLTGIFFTLVVSVCPSFAQEGLYIGGNLNGVSLGGDLAPSTSIGTGANFILGIQTSSTFALELEAYASLMRLKDSSWETAYLSGFNLNFKRLFSPGKKLLHPYFIVGLGASGFAWQYPTNNHNSVDPESDGIAAFTLAPGFGFEFQINRFIALNTYGRFFSNSWGKKTMKGKESGYESGNTFMVNLGILMHF